MGDRTQATWELWLIEPLDEDEANALKSELELLRKRTGYQEAEPDGKVLRASCEEWNYPMVEQLGEQYKTLGNLTKAGKLLVELFADSGGSYDACYGALHRDLVFRAPRLEHEGPVISVPLTDKPDVLRKACETVQEMTRKYRALTAIMEKAIPWPRELQEAFVGGAETA
ncbi:hypothetical protein Ocepr_2263 (plasmid) [Oceanithermus profundus DSM 14977]|uniref:Uncharacterized protein n=1 Tax=Oceanithermus profundus (strain DSM 14977 / NBRC 100410 / VKM B-2274 / 506) TaxID=670487 RepID=E4UAS6_OCEP5|nr:hypothetical protein [Oceanithermus profundus]ADR37711.1 hypothetical protein Ocepr_2263 [Oceanithermus profundus DSM 14977]